MKNESCKNNQHNWVCRKILGVFGEIIEEKKIKISKDISLLDSESLRKFCPDGQNVCAFCGIALLNNIPISKSAIQALVSKEVINK